MDREKVIAQLKEDEGWRPYVYQDHLGFQTIGYGFLVDARRGDGLPPEVAEFWLQWLVDSKWKVFLRHVPWVAEQPEEVQGALVNMVYQLGVSGTLAFKNMLAALQAGDRQAAAQQALDSRWARQTPNRASRVAAMIRGGEAQT